MSEMHYCKNSLVENLQNKELVYLHLAHIKQVLSLAFCTVVSLGFLCCIY
jgi:hypothetical protein